MPEAVLEVVPVHERPDIFEHPENETFPKIAVRLILDRSMNYLVAALKVVEADNYDDADADLSRDIVDDIVDDADLSWDIDALNSAQTHAAQTHSARKHFQVSQVVVSQNLLVAAVTI